MLNFDNYVIDLFNSSNDKVSSTKSKTSKAQDKVIEYVKKGEAKARRGSVDVNTN